MEIARGEIWWADLPDPVASDPGGTRPVLVVQTNAFNRSRIATILVAVITTNQRLADLPGNVPLSPRGTGLKQPSVVNVSQVITADRTFLRERIGGVSPQTMARVDSGLKLVIGSHLGPGRTDRDAGIGRDPAKADSGADTGRGAGCLVSAFADGVCQLGFDILMYQFVHFDAWPERRWQLMMTC